MDSPLLARMEARSPMDSLLLARMEARWITTRWLDSYEWDERFRELEKLGVWMRELHTELRDFRDFGDGKHQIEQAVDETLLWLHDLPCWSLFRIKQKQLEQLVYPIFGA